MDNYTPSRVNRYWKRPKLRVYDCNVRDAERFYQDSYKQYLSEKEEGARRASRARSIDASRATTEFYPHLLAGSFKPEAREDLVRQINLPSVLAEATKNRWESDHKVPETSFTARQEGLADFDPRDTASIEERYQKLRKLREELNLSAEGAESSALGSLRSGSVGVGGGGGRYGAEKDSYLSEQSSRSLAAGGGPDEASSYTTRSERMARMNGNAGGNEGYRFQKDTNTSEYKRGGDQNSYEYRMRSDRGGDQGSSEYTSRFRSERGGASDKNSYDYKSRFDRNGDQNSLEYKPRSERGATGEQSSYEYRSRSDRGGDENSLEYKFKSDRSTNGQSSYEYKPRSERGTGEATSTEYKFKSDRGGDSSDYKSRFELKSDDYKPASKVDFDLPRPDRKKDDYSFSSSSDRKADRYSSLSSTSAASASTDRKSLTASTKDDDKEVDDDNVSDMMKKLPSSQEILERISKMELDD